MQQKSFLTRLGETIDAHRAAHQSEKTIQSAPLGNQQMDWLRWFFPTPGNVIFTLLVIGSLLWAQSVGAVSLAAPSVNSSLTIPYQGRLANASGTPFTGNQNMEFRLYNAPSGGTPLWSELWTGGNSVTVNDGSFSVLLGSLTAGLPAVVQSNGQLWLGITVGTDGEMSPRVQLGSAAYSMQALTVPDGSVTGAKIANNTIIREKLTASALPRLLGEKSCFSCGDSEDVNPPTGWVNVKGANGEIIETTVTTSGRPLVVSMIARLATDVESVHWCGIQVLQNNTNVRHVHIDGRNTGVVDSACAGSVTLTDLPAGTYTFRAHVYVSSITNVRWIWERQISVIEL